MRITKRLLAAMLTLGFGAACNSSPRLIDYPQTNSHSEIRDQVNSAPIVIVGVILSDTLVRRPIPSHWDPKLPLQLRRLELRVENSLRGEIADGTIVVYYFGFAGGFDGPRPLGFWSIAGRRIFWLRRDSGTLRTACDGFDYCTSRVGSGAHPHYKPDPNKPLGYALADICLTRGERIADDDFARQIDSGVPGTVPEPYLFEKLQQLAATEVPVVRAVACRQLSYYRQKCVEAGAKPGA